MRREKMKAILRTKAVKKWKWIHYGREPDDSQVNSFCTGFNMGWKSLKEFLRRRKKRGTSIPSESIPVRFGGKGRGD